MAPVQPSASVAATGLGIRYVGDYVYAYSGLYVASTTVETKLEFTTGAGFIVGQLQLNAPVSTGSVQKSIATIFLNDIEVAIISVIGSTSNQGYNGSETQNLIIPPLTKVQVTVDSTDDQAGQKGSVTFTGRVYGTE